jgi:hypothetical protein
MASIERGSAKIYQFPAGGRRMSPRATDSGHVVTMSSPPIAQTEFGSGWYHDEAIRDDDATRKN